MARQPAGRHPLAAGSLVMGLCFCGIALMWLLVSTDAMSPSDLQFAVPGLLVGTGVIGVLASLRRGSSPKAGPDQRRP